MTTTDVYVVYLNRYKIIYRYKLGGWMVGLFGLLNGWVYVVVVLTLTHRYNAVCVHTIGSKNSGAEDPSKGKTN